VSALKTLIRLHRWQIDERQRQVAELEGLAERLRGERTRLAAERAHEQAAAVESLAGQLAYPGYIRRALERQATLERSLGETEAQIAQARDALADAFQELKRHEIAEASRDYQRRQQQARRDRIELDAVAIETYRRRSGSAAR